MRRDMACRSRCRLNIVSAVDRLALYHSAARALELPANFANKLVTQPKLAGAISDELSSFDERVPVGIGCESVRLLARGNLGIGSKQPINWHPSLLRRSGSADLPAARINGVDLPAAPPRTRPVVAGKRVKILWVFR